MAAAVYSEKQAFRFESWKSAYMHLGSRMVTLNDLRLQGTAACIFQMLLLTILPIVWYFLLYKDDPRLVMIPILTWVVTSFTACLGVAGFVVLKSLLLGLHGVLALALGAALGVFDTFMYFILNDVCDRTQASFKGCIGCLCASNSTCTTDMLEQLPQCAACKAWGTNVCDEATGASSILPYMGLIELLCLVFPAVFSLMVLVRMEKERGDNANRALYARAVVLRELRRIEAQRGLNVDLQVFKSMLRLVLRCGSSKDRAAVARCCELLSLDMEALAEGPDFDDGARGMVWHDGHDGYGSGSAAASGIAGPSFKVGSATMANEEYIKKHQNFLNSSFTQPAPPATPVSWGSRSHHTGTGSPDLFASRPASQQAGVAGAAGAAPAAGPSPPVHSLLQELLETQKQQQDAGKVVLRLGSVPADDGKQQQQADLPGGLHTVSEDAVEEFVAALGDEEQGGAPAAKAGGTASPAPSVRGAASLSTSATAAAAAAPGGTAAAAAGGVRPSATSGRSSGLLFSSVGGAHAAARAGSTSGAAAGGTSRFSSSGSLPAAGTAAPAAGSNLSRLGVAGPSSSGTNAPAAGLTVLRISAGTSVSGGTSSNAAARANASSSSGIVASAGSRPRDWRVGSSSGAAVGAGGSGSGPGGLLDRFADTRALAELEAEEAAAFAGGPARAAAAPVRPIVSPAGASNGRPNGSRERERAQPVLSLRDLELQVGSSVAAAGRSRKEAPGTEPDPGPPPPAAAAADSGAMEAVEDATAKDGKKKGDKKKKRDKGLLEGAEADAEEGGGGLLGLLKRKKKKKKKKEQQPEGLDPQPGDAEDEGGADGGRDKKKKKKKKDKKKAGDDAAADEAEAGVVTDYAETLTDAGGLATDAEEGEGGDASRKKKKKKDKKGKGKKKGVQEEE